METSSHLIPTRFEGPKASHEALRLNTRHGTAVIALQGGHVLSWQPNGEREVFWVSPDSLPEPAAIRGGVPVCWPWFAKQGQSATARQHGPVRHLKWTVSTVHEASEEAVSLSLVPAWQEQALAGGHPLAEGVPPGLRLRMALHLGAELRQSLHTDNHTGAPFPLTQALHSYFAVSHAERVAIEGLQGLHYSDKLRDYAVDVQHQPFALAQACDRIYANPSLHPRYVVCDPAWQRAIEIEVQGSRSVVVWNPGAETACQMVDVPDAGWPDFFCVEAANAGTDVIDLAPGQCHVLQQTLRVRQL